MARYAKQNLRRSSTMAMVAQRSEKYSSDITQDMNTDDLPESQKVKLRFLRDQDLVDDPDNITVYGSEYQIDNLAEVMKEYGFQGVILAYPIEGGKYRIESGHRRRLAARKAGIETIPVLETVPPKTEYERKRRLFGANLLERDKNPIITARVADNLYYTFRDEYEYKKENDLLDKDEDGNLIESGDIIKKVSAFMGLDVRTITKYRTLLKLIPKLQEMAASKEYSWTALTDAVTLSDQKQEELVCDIQNEPESVTKAWIIKKCRELKQEEIKIDQENNKGQAVTQANAPKSKAAGYIKPKVATKKIKKYSSELTEVLKDEYVIPEKDLEQTINELEDLSKIISEKIEVLMNRFAN